jgi:hypothetical protein
MPVRFVPTVIARARERSIIVTPEPDAVIVQDASAAGGPSTIPKRPGSAVTTGAMYDVG